MAIVGSGDNSSLELVPNILEKIPLAEFDPKDSLDFDGPGFLGSRPCFLGVYVNYHIFTDM